MAKYTPRQLTDVGRGLVTGGMTGAQWTVLGMLLFVMVIEIVFGPYSRNLIDEFRSGDGKDQKIFVTKKGLALIILFFFGLAFFLIVTAAAPKAGMMLAGLLLLTVMLARYNPVVNWIDQISSFIAELPKEAGKTA